MHVEPDAARTFTVPARYDLDETLRFTRFGPGDPTARRGAGWFVKAWRSPAGEVTLRVEQRPPDRVEAAAWGPGSAWALAHAPALLGLHDRGDAFDPGPLLAGVARRFGGMRLARVPWPLDKLIAYVFQQRVAFEEAAASWRSLLRRHGDRAPGPQPLKLMPPARTLLALPDHDWQVVGLDRQRRGTVREVLRYAHRIQETADMALPDVRRRLAALRGVGPWTLEITMGFGFGDPDAVPIGDYNLPAIVSWALAGEAEATDERMLALLEPFAGQRFRVIRWLFARRVLGPRRAWLPGR
jgi:endonuclease III